MEEISRGEVWTWLTNSRGWTNYLTVLGQTHLLQFLLNSLAISLPATIGTLALSCMAGFALALRFLYYYLFPPPYAVGMVQSLILSSVLMIVGFQVVLIGLLADVLSGTRKLLEDLLYRVRRMELGEDGRGGGGSAQD